MSRWSKYLNWQGSRLGQWLIAGSAGIQGVLLSEKWKVETWVALGVCCVPIFLMSLGRVAKRLGMWHPVGAAAHLLLSTLSIDYLVRTDRPSWADLLLLLLLVPGAALAVGILVTRSSGSHPESEAANSGTAGPTGSSNEPIE